MQAITIACSYNVLKTKWSSFHGNQPSRNIKKQNKKMGWKSSVIIHLGFWFYLVGGGAVYYYIEDPSYHLPPQPKRNIIGKLVNVIVYVVVLVYNRINV